jgi:hypothetical protein
VSASEFAFLALGLVLGVATGAALIEVLRARPPAPRLVRVTVGPDSVPRRIPATLATDPFAPPPPRPALDEHDFGPIEAPRQPNRRTIVRSEASNGGGTMVDRPTFLPRYGVVRPGGPSGASASFEAGRMIGIPIRPEPDEFLARFAPRSADRPGPRLVGVGVALLERVDVAMATAAANEQGSSNPTSEATAPCADERRLAEERCALADRAREQAEAAQVSIRKAQRAYDEHLTRAERAGATLDPRSVRQAKELAHAAFRRARAAAGGREEVEAAARVWLQEINRINNEAREAGIVAARERDAANAMVTVIERLSVEADAARISADVAAEACVAARESVANCEEANEARAPSRTPRRSLVPDGSAEPAGSLVGTSAGTDRDADDDAIAATAGEAAILRLLRGDRATRLALVERLAGSDPAERRRWQLILSDLVDAIVGRAIEAAALDFPENHAFWGGNLRTENRDIVTALASLGYRFDGLGSFADGRVPSQRDLSLAVGYAGLDPKRIRRWPNEAEMAGLMSEVTVSADEYLAEEAGSLTLGELIDVLGRRADPLAELWNSWGRVRPLLLATE